MNTKEVTIKIIAIFETFRMKPIPSIDRWQQEGKQVFSEKVEKYVNAYQPIQFFMLGYPFKSLNHRDKTIGILPDLGEEMSLKNFITFNNAIKEVYSQGVEIHIASDGFVFNDILGEFDSTVKEYQLINESIIGNSNPIFIHNLTNFYSSFGGRLSDLREHFMSQWAISEAELQNRILNDLDTTMLYRGMSIFMEEHLYHLTRG